MSISSSAVGGRTKYKIIFLGDQSVGKSSIIEKFVKNKFEDGLTATIGIDFHIKNVSRNGQQYRMQLWDTAGQERFRSLIPNYMKDAHCAVLVYDITKATSLQNIKIWNDMFQEHQNSEAIKVFVGNKIDRENERQVSTEEGQTEATKYRCKHFEVSAKQGNKLEDLFNCVIDLIVERSQNKGDTSLSSIKQQRKPMSKFHTQQIQSQSFGLKNNDNQQVASGCCGL